MRRFRVGDLPEDKQAVTLRIGSRSENFGCLDMPVSIGQGPSPDFDRPIELLMDCHRRIEKFLLVLDRVADKAILDAEMRPALDTALNYFKTAGTRHNTDEEGDLFPALSALDGQAAELMQKMDRLAAEHRMAEKVHHRLDELGGQWLKANQLSDVDLAEFRRLIKQLIGFYARHIAMEETEVFPMAAKALDPATLQQIGRNMRARRVENPGRSESQCAQRRKTRWE